MRDDDEWNGHPFGLENLIRVSRGGSLPAGYLDAYKAYQRRLHAKLDAEIKAALAQAAHDPEMLARLNRPLL
jgi:hypothetical protein